LLRRRCVYRRFVWRRFVEETFCRGDVLYVRPLKTFRIWLRIRRVIRDNRLQIRIPRSQCDRRIGFSGLGSAPHCDTCPLLFQSVPNCWNSNPTVAKQCLSVVTVSPTDASVPLCCKVSPYCGKSPQLLLRNVW
jgi:hypothetical protein